MQAIPTIGHDAHGAEKGPNRMQSLAARTSLDNHRTDKRGRRQDQHQYQRPRSGQRQTEADYARQNAERYERNRVADGVPQSDSFHQATDVLVLIRPFGPVAKLRLTQPTTLRLR